MCNSKADGGQRCAAHARASMAAALDARDRIEALIAVGKQPYDAYMAAQGRVLCAEIAYASTDEGVDHFRAAWRAALRGSDMAHIEHLESVLARGAYLRERNQQYKDAGRNRPAPKRAKHELTLTPDEIREGLARALTETEAEEAWDSLTATMVKFENSFRTHWNNQNDHPDPIHQTLDAPDKRLDRRRHSESREAIRDAATRVWTLRRRRDMSAVDRWETFKAQTRAGRDNVPDAVVFADLYKRDSNFLLRVCGTIVVANAQGMPSR